MNDVPLAFLRNDYSHAMLSRRSAEERSPLTLYL
jgi:hypothetical protein